MIESNWQELKDKLSVLFLISITGKDFFFLSISLFFLFSFPVFLSIYLFFFFFFFFTVKEIMSQIVIGDIALLVIQKIRLKQGERENTLDAATKPASEINQALKMEIARLELFFFPPSSES